MKAVATITWDEIRDWLAEAGSICSGFYVEYQETRNAHHNSPVRRRLYPSRRQAKADPAISWVIGNREF